MMVALAAHSLMGGAAFLGAGALHARCAQIEDWLTPANLRL
jgi:HPt (histidine-containing phosphotransfer) domain-containing protein